MNTSFKPRRLRLEHLEDRVLLAVAAGGIGRQREPAGPTGSAAWVVNTLADPAERSEADSVVSLREAVERASAGDTIRFDPSLAGGVIALGGSPLEVTAGITIDASGIGGITIDGRGKSSVFHIVGGTEANPAELIGLTITRGTGDDFGGGIYNAGTLLIADSTVFGSDANYGGGIYSSGSLTVTNCAVYGNDAYLSGGGIYAVGSLTVTRSTISGNSANESGGGICAVSGTAAVTDTAVSGNVGFYTGGGIYAESAALTVTGATVAGNAAETGGGIYVDSGELSLTNTIAALNDAASEIDVHGSYSGSHNLVGVDPGFAAPPVFEEGTLVNFGELDLSLSSGGSAAIDAGLNDAVRTEADAAGNPRIFAAWKETPTVDIGAYEFQKVYETPSTVVTTPLDLFDLTDGLISLREAIFYAAAGGTVTFAPSLAECVITLAGTQLEITKAIAVDASSAGGVTIDAGGRSRVFCISGGSADAPVILTGLTMTGGYATDGGGIYFTGALVLTDCAVTGNTAAEKGGGIYNSSGDLTLTNSVVEFNDARLADDIYDTALYPDLDIDIAALSSKPDSLYTLYLDFDGHVTSGTSWNSRFGGADIVTPRFNTDGNREKTSFSAADEAAIYEIWLRVSEDFMPFDLNVTTVEPPPESFTDGRAQRVVIGGANSDWYNSSGVVGISFRSSFTRKADVPNFVFSETLGNDPNGIATVVSHEAGHTLGLGHKGKGKKEYYSGTKGWGPLMGNPINQKLTQWSKGEYKDASNTDDELEILTTQNGFGYRDDDYGDSFDEAAVLSIVGGKGKISGIVERNTDVDYFVFESDGSALEFFIGGIPRVTNLDVLVNVYSENRQLIRTYNDDERLDAEFIFEEAAGTYYLTVEGTGRKISQGIYSDYGSLGAYTVQVGTPDGLVVTTLDDSFGDDGYLSLREALALAEHRTTITFDPSLAGGTFRLEDVYISVGRSAVVDASSIGGLTIEGDGRSRIFNVSGGTADSPMTMIGLTITGGIFGFGGGIYNSGCLKLVNCVVTGNTGTTRGGGIYNAGTLALVNSTVSGNTSVNGGGISQNSSPVTTMINSIVALNDAASNTDFDGTWSGDNNIVGDDPGFTVAPIFEDGVLVNAGELDFSLAAGSAAIDAGASDAVETEVDIAGNPRIVGGVVDIGAYEYGASEALDAPTILTGSRGIYVSYGANRHYIQWGAVAGASGYEVRYTTDGSNWTSVSAGETGVVSEGLAYGAEATYRVRALGSGSSADSAWSAEKTFRVCPMDADGNGDISGSDRGIVAGAWLAEEGDDRYRYCADIDADGDVSNSDRALVSLNWLASADDDGLIYPRAAAADAVFAEYASAEIGAGTDLY